MKLIIWTPDFSVGVASIDEQHKGLIAMVNRLMAEPRTTTQSETISALLSDLTKYAEEHFAAEEELMRRHNYPRLDEHIAQHLTFRNATVDFCMAAMNDDGTVPEAMFRYLCNWLVEHILNSDMDYKPYCREQ